MKCMNLFLNKRIFPSGKILFTGLLIFPSVLFAQQKLTLSDAISEGIQHNFQINVAKNETEIAQNEVSLGNAGYLPQIMAHGSLDKAIVNAKVKVFTDNELDQSGAKSTVSAAALRADWTLFEGLGRSAVYDKLKELWNISTLETRITIEEVIADIIKSYCRIIRDKQLMVACRERLVVSNFRYHIASRKLNAGLASEMELLQSQVLYHTDSTDLTLQEAAYLKSKITLNQLLAAEIQRDFLTEDSITLSPLPALDDLITSGLEKNSGYKLASRQMNLSKFEIKELKARQYPKISLSGSYNYYKNETEASFILFNRNFGPQIGVNAGISLYDGSRLRRDLESARINIQNHELLVKDMEQELTSLIIQTYLDHQSHLKSISLSREGYNLAVKNLSIAKDALKAGVISSLRFREAQEELFQASSNLVNAIFDAKNSETDLLRLSGMLIQ
jgi:outer membrane protein